MPISADQDTAGPITRNVTDAAVMLGAMTGIDADDPATAAQAGHAFTDYTQFLDADALDGARIGVWREGTYDPTASSPDVDAILNQTSPRSRAQGAIIVDPAQIEIEPAYEPEFTALLCEFKTDIAAYLQAHTAAGYPKTLQDLIDFNDAHPDLEGPWNSELFVEAQATNGRGDPACTAARDEATSTAKAAIDDLMAADDLDAVIAPTNGPAWVTDPVNGDLGGDFSTFVGSSSPSAISGYAVDHGAGGLRRAAAGGRLVHRRPMGRAGADRPRLRFRAGVAGPRAAVVPAVARRRGARARTPRPPRDRPGGSRAAIGAHAASLSAPGSRRGATPRRAARTQEQSLHT